MQTLYKYFKVPPEGACDEFEIKDRYPLYAITPDKDLARDFESQRDMTKFVRIKEKFPEDYVMNFINNHVAQELQYRDIAHYDRTPNEEGYHESTEYPILTTWTEMDMVDMCVNDAILQDLFDEEMCKSNPLIFSDKYIKALNLLGYLFFYSTINVNMEKKMEECMEEFGDLSTPEFWIDPLNTFLYLYGDTFSKNFGA